MRQPGQSRRQQDYVPDDPFEQLASSLVRELIHERPELSLSQCVDSLGEAMRAGPSRPQLRSECRSGPRPCPWVGCRYHLFLDVKQGGNLRFGFGSDLEVLSAMPSTCALDVAEQGEHSMTRLGHYLNLCAERVRQELVVAQQNAAHACPDPEPVA